MESIVLDFKELRKEDNEIVGKKCANLGELTRGGFRVPPGFAITVNTYKRFMTETGLVDKIEKYLSGIALDPYTTAGLAQFEQAEKDIRKMVEETAMPKDIEDCIRKSYKALCDAEGVEALPVATRSAGPASHPGQYETFLHIRGADDVVFNVKKVWSSTFNARSLVARARQNLSLSFDPIGVAVLKMVNAKAAGVMFTLNPSNGDTTKIFIEGNWGLGEAVVSGEVSPDSFIVDKNTFRILKRNVTPKTIWYVPDKETGHVTAQRVPEEIRNSQCISDEEIQELARVGIEIEKYFGAPQDIEWSIDSELQLPKSVFFVQTRNTTKKFEQKSASDRIVDMLMRGF